MNLAVSIVSHSGRVVGVVEMVSHLLPLGFSAGCHTFSKKSTNAFTARTRTPSGHFDSIPGTLPAPGVLQTVQNRVRAARAERVRMVCHVRYESVLEGLLWGF